MNNMLSRAAVALLLSTSLCSLPTAAHAEQGGLARHKRPFAVPRPGPVKINGKLDDWDLSGQIEMFVIEATRSTQCAKFALMYDDQALYVSGDVNDTTPMMNRHDPKVDPDKGWSTEYAIPFSALVGSDNLSPHPGDEWRINLYRIDSPEPKRLEYYAWSPTGANDFHRPWCFGVLKFR